MIIRIRYNQEYNGQTYLGCGKNDLPEAENSLTTAFMGETRVYFITYKSGGCVDLM